jgi:hypothetical protein
VLAALPAEGHAREQRVVAAARQHVLHLQCSGTGQGSMRPGWRFTTSPKRHQQALGTDTAVYTPPHCVFPGCRLVGMVTVSFI